MNVLTEFRATEEAIKELQARLSSLSQDDKLKSELEFEGKLRNLMGHYQKSLRDIIAILDPDTKLGKGIKVGKGGSVSRKPRELKTYKNPNTGEIVQTKGGNHKVLKAWKIEHGSETVESWLEEKSA